MDNQARIQKIGPTVRINDAPIDEIGARFEQEL